MSSYEKKIITKTLAWLEASGEIQPGSAEVLLERFERGDDLADDIAGLFDHVYGRCEIMTEARDDAGRPVALPAIEPSPYLAPSRKSRDLPPVQAVMRNLSHLLRFGEDEAKLASQFVRLTELGSKGAIARGIVKHLYDDRKNHGMLTDPPPLPGNVARAKRAIESMGRYLERHVDTTELAWSWKDLGSPSIDEDEARRRLAVRLSDPQVAARVCVGGAVPEIASSDVYGSPSQARVDHEAALRQSGKYAM